MTPHKEYWVNVYKVNSIAGTHYWYGNAHSIRPPRLMVDFPVYRIHVKVDGGNGTRRANYPFRMVNGIVKLSKPAKTYVGKYEGTGFAKDNWMGS